MTFLLKKFVSFWLMPLQFCVTLLILGFWFSHPNRRPGFGRFLIAVGLILLLLFSNKAVSTALVQPLETIHAPIPELALDAPLPDALARCRFVVVLGGGHGDTAELAAVNKLSSSALARLAESVRLLRALPEAKLVVCGRGKPGEASHAEVLAKAAISLGVDSRRIVQLDLTRDTIEEAVALRELAQDQPIALVTSAWHMPRAFALMRTRGLDALPCPCDHSVRPATKRTWTDFTWDMESLARSTRAIHERLGQLWNKIRPQS